MSIEALLNRAKEILNSNQYINVATVTPEGLPWNTPVYALYDQDLNFYWSSWKNADHSINIRSCNHVFVTLYDSTRKRGDNNRRCVYMSGKVKELDEPSQIKTRLVLLYGDEAQSMSAEEYHSSAIKRIYMFSPSAVWLNDLSERQVANETVKMRVEVPLENLIASIRF